MGFLSDINVLSSKPQYMFVHLKTSLDHGDSCHSKICLCLLERGKAAQHFINHWVYEPHIQ